MAGRQINFNRVTFLEVYQFTFNYNSETAEVIFVTHLYQVDSSTLTLWTGPGRFPIYGTSGQFLLSPCFIEITVFNANSVDPDQTPRSGSTLINNVTFMGR